MPNANIRQHLIFAMQHLPQEGRRAISISFQQCMSHPFAILVEIKTDLTEKLFFLFVIQRSRVVASIVNPSIITTGE
jgi:hypothetical protein